MAHNPIVPPFVSQVWVYPVKSLPGESVAACRITAGGALENDRRRAIVDSEGRFVNAKRTAAIHRLAPPFDAANLGRQLGFEVHLVENAESGFPDDDVSPGPTIIAAASLAEIASWFDGESADSLRERLRPNIVVGGVPAFWEDRLYGAQFTIGEVEICGVNPCQRCVVPSRHPSTGDETPGFQRRFADMRRDTLPDWAPRAMFTHFYRASANTVIPGDEAGKLIHAGDQIRLPWDG
jgi:uncharacterized protein YcbX